MKSILHQSYTIGKVVVASLLITSVFGISSCKKFTELNPINGQAQEDAFKTPANIELVMQGVYEAAAIGSYNNDKLAARGYPFGAAAIQQGEMRGEDMLNIDQFFAITYEGGYNPASANNNNHWFNLYALINQANILIEGVKGAGSKGIITADQAKVYEAEARFLRALSVHELLIHFSRPFADGAGNKLGVPYRTRAVTNIDAINEEAKMPRGTVAEDYTKILEDLDYAENTLPDVQTKGFSRATKGAAIALKIRIKQHKGDWPGVITEGAKLGTAGTGAVFTSPVGAYKLTDDPAGPFANFKSNSESIFSIANGPLSNGGTNGSLAGMFGPGDRGARGLVATSPILYNAAFWVAGDKRRELMQVRQEKGAKYYFNFKYRDYTNKTDWAPIMRYAEVLLNVAEAYARTGDNAQALKLLNAVRDRSVPADKRFTTAPADLILAILNERRIEFTGEGRRWADLHRLALDPVYGTNGIPAKLKASQLVKDGTDYNFVTPPTFTGVGVPKYDYDNYRFLWPLPTEEVAANPVLRAQQNPGY